MKNKKYVALAKRTKKERKAYHDAKRKDWGQVKPVTQKTPHAKAYDRKKSNRQWDADSDG